jgi:predicted dehydrogenase
MNSAVCARSQSTIAAVLEAYDVPFGTTDYRELVARDDVDVVTVFSPDHLHVEHCVAALENDKHVIGTKPMVTAFEHALSLVTLTREHNRKFLVGQTMRFDRQFVMAKKQYHDCDLGRPPDRHQEPLHSRHAPCVRLHTLAQVKPGAPPLLVCRRISRSK